MCRQCKGVKGYVYGQTRRRMQEIPSRAKMRAPWEKGLKKDREAKKMRDRKKQKRRRNIGISLVAPAPENERAQKVAPSCTADGKSTRAEKSTLHYISRAVNGAYQVIGVYHVNILSVTRPSQQER